jgi:hypothetical protein
VPASLAKKTPGDATIMKKLSSPRLNRLLCGEFDVPIEQHKGTVDHARCLVTDNSFCLLSVENADDAGLTCFIMFQPAACR